MPEQVHRETQPTKSRQPESSHAQKDKPQELFDASHGVGCQSYDLLKSKHEWELAALLLLWERIQIPLVLLLLLFPNIQNCLEAFE